MLYLSTKITNLGIFVIKLGGKIGYVTKPIINPHNLHIDAFCCYVKNENKELVLLDVDVRDLSLKGIIINDNNDLSEKDDLLRLKEIINVNFELIGKIVVSGSKKIGKVTDYAIDNSSLYIIKLYVRPLLWQSFTTSDMVIDRSSIIEVNDKNIIVSGPEQKSRADTKESSLNSFGQRLSSANNALTNE